jgi:pimeloyl-ACP methyl ester carboxylesterase
MSQVIYCISGLGAGEKIFRNLQVEGFELRYIPWLLPEKNETITTYAGRMASVIKDTSPVILGVSFGGMVGIEIARLLPVRKLFIISSIKSVGELPGWMKLAARLKLNEIVPVRSFSYAEAIGNRRLGVSNAEERDMVRAYRKNADPFYVKWAIRQIINWRNSWQPECLVQINGDQDKIFPVKKLRPSHIIRDGTHLMIYNRAAEISEIILHELQKGD